jgi:hypothetical protein
MNIERKVWPPKDDVGGLLADNPPSFAVDTRHERVEQPAFGIEIGWNQPKKWWQPYISISLWTVFVQVGWLYF